VASAITGASRPDQIDENVGASGVALDDGVLAAIDEVLGDAIGPERPSERTTGP
jgi:aryl-alcohol dehydrogenase-like predicted oxidoreductase